MPLPSFLAGCVIAVAGTLLSAASPIVAAPAPAGGVEIVMRNVNHTAGNCQAALPAFETNLRKRPLGLVNEGDATLFVTCAFTSGGYYGHNPQNATSAEIWIRNGATTARTISCTGVAGGGYGEGAPAYITRSRHFEAGSGQAPITWYASDFPGAPSVFPSGLFSISCQVPTDAVLVSTFVIYRAYANF